MQGERLACKYAHNGDACDLSCRSTNQMRARKLGNIEPLKPDVIAAGNIGCITQLAAGTTTPVVHTIELLDWASGGPVPEPLAAIAKAPAS